MSIINPECGDIGQWQFLDGHGRCPDCSDTVPAASIPTHVGWHFGVRRSLFGSGGPIGRFAERFDDGSGDLAWTAHLDQIARLGPDETF